MASLVNLLLAAENLVIIGAFGLLGYGIYQLVQWIRGLADDPAGSLFGTKDWKKGITGLDPNTNTGDAGLGFMGKLFHGDVSGAFSSLTPKNVFKTWFTHFSPAAPFFLLGNLRTAFNSIKDNW